MIVFENSFCQFMAKLRIFGNWFSHSRLEKSVSYSFGPPGIIKIHIQAPILVFCNCLFFEILRIDFFQKICKKIQIFWFKLVDTPNSSKFSEFFFPFNPRFRRYRTFKKKRQSKSYIFGTNEKLGINPCFQLLRKTSFFDAKWKLGKNSFFLEKPGY